MVRHTLSALLCLVSSSIALAEYSVDFKKIDQLEKSKKYFTAYEMLVKSDPFTMNPSIVARRIKILRTASLICLNGEGFALKDFKPGEDIESVRKKVGEYDLVWMKQETLDIIFEKYKGNVSVMSEMGLFYAESLANCGATPERLEKGKRSLQNAVDLGSKDPWVMSRLAAIYLEDGDAAHAVTLLEETAGKPNTPGTAYYNLAVAKLRLQKPKEALAHAQKAYSLYTSKKEKSESAIVAAFALIDLERPKEAREYAEKAYREKYLNYYYVYGKLIELYIELKDWKRLIQLTDEFYALGPTKPQLPQDVLAMFFTGSADNELPAFFERNLKKYEKDNEATGNLLFHRADMWFRMGKTEIGKKDLVEARSRFEKVFKPDHSVFKVIDQRLKS